MTEREALRRTFDEAAELYERARPGYPEELFDDLTALAGLGDGARVLEIGCGTGKATRSLARRGLGVVCVELGESLAAVARRELAGFPDVRVLTESFETWDSGGDLFELVFAATAWHWLDPDVRFAKAAGLLRPGGSLAIVATHHAFPRDADPFFREIQDVYDDIGEGLPEWAPPLPEDHPDESAEIAASGFFHDVRVRRYVWARDYTAEDYVDVLETYSGHRSMTEEQRERLYGEIRRRIAARPDGLIRKHYLNILHVARRR